SRDSSRGGSPPFRRSGCLAATLRAAARRSYRRVAAGQPLLRCRDRGAEAIRPGRDRGAEAAPTTLFLCLRGSIWSVQAGRFRVSAPHLTDTRAERMIARADSFE